MEKTLIFLSYARDDEDEVKRIYKRLQDEGYHPWMDQFDILPGENWQLSIKTALKKAEFFLVFLSPNSVYRRGYLQREIRLALDSGDEMLMSDIYLIPVRLSKCSIPDELSSFQCVDIFDDTGWDRLLLAIKTGLKKRKNDPRRNR
jgi:hypothetical protein